MQEHLELEEQKLQQTLLRAETLPEVEAELAQLVAALSKVLLWVPGGRAGEGLFHAVPPCPSPCCSVNKGAQTRGRAARLGWERALSVRQSPLPCHRSLNFPPVLPRVLCVPRILQLRVTAAQSSVSNSKPSRIES